MALSLSNLVAAAQLQLVPIAFGLDQPLFMTQGRGERGRFHIVEKTGKIRVLTAGQLLPTPFLDLGPYINTEGERGLLGLAFDPDYQENGWFYAHYNSPDGNTVIARFQVSSDPLVANMFSRKVILTVPQPAFANHKGGMLAFGPDGMLYAGLGDGGGGGDPSNNAQNLRSLLGKILRLDVHPENDNKPYVVPEDNPFAKESGGRKEIWSLGWRNPWRFSFDRKTGAMWVGDVGQSAYEEIDFEAKGKGGRNYGWRLREGRHPYLAGQPGGNVKPTGPLIEYAQGENTGQSVAGGYQYRGAAMPKFRGHYFYGDFVSGRIWSSWVDGNRRRQGREWLDTDLSIASFAEDLLGEVYVIDFGGTIYRLAQGQ